MVGSGIFGLPGALVQSAGPLAPTIVLAVGVAFLPIVFCLAQLAKLFDVTGGPIAYVDEAFGPAAGFQVGWISLLSSSAGAAANINLLADYVIEIIGGGSFAHGAIVLGAFGVLLIVNLCDAGRSSGVLRLLSLAKGAPLLWLLSAAVLVFPVNSVAATSAVHLSPSHAVLLAAYAFIGFEGTLTIAGEAQRPKRDLPRMLVAVFVFVALLYAALTWAYMATVQDPAGAAPLARMGRALGGAIGQDFVILGAVISILGNAAANCLLLSRRIVALEEGGSLPSWFGRIHSSSGVPRNAVVFVIMALTLLAMSGGFLWLAILTVTSRVLVYLGCLVSLPVIRWRRGFAAFRVSDWTLVLAVSACIALLAQSPAWGAVLMAVLAGFLVLAISRRIRLVSSWA